MTRIIRDPMRQALPDTRTDGQIGARSDGYERAPVDTAGREVQCWLPICPSIGMETNERPLIMVVDDDQDLLQAMSFLLDRFGYAVDARGTPPNWIDLQTTHPSLIFMDVELLGFNGVHVCKSIKENLANWKLPVVLTSAHSEVELEKEPHYCHADAILPKPFTSGAVKRLAEHFAGK